MDYKNNSSSSSSRLVAAAVAVIHYRVRQNKISQRKIRDIYIVQEYFLHKIFHIYLSHMSSQVSLILLG